MQRKYPSLKRDTYWVKMSDNFYNDTKDVINNKRYRKMYRYPIFKKANNNMWKFDFISSI